MSRRFFCAMVFNNRLALDSLRFIDDRNFIKKTGREKKAELPPRLMGYALPRDGYNALGPISPVRIRIARSRS